MRGDSGSDTLLGSTGSDRLLGGNDDDLLDGGRGIDRLWGHAGRDLLVGGTDSDSLWGGSAEDLLIAGHTPLGTPELAAVFEEWRSERSFATRIANILGPSEDTSRLNGEHYLKPDDDPAGVRNIHDDADGDYLRGGLAGDWLFAELTDTVRGIGKFDELEVL